MRITSLPTRFFSSCTQENLLDTPLQLNLNQLAEKWWDWKTAFGLKVTFQGRFHLNFRQVHLLVGRHQLHLRHLHGVFSKNKQLRWVGDFCFNPHSWFIWAKCNFIFSPSLDLPENKGSHFTKLWGRHVRSRPNLTKCTGMSCWYLVTGL